MPLSHEVVKSLGYLREKYKVSERDLVSLAKKLKIEEPGETWEEITQRVLRNRKGRFVRATNRKR